MSSPLTPEPGHANTVVETLVRRGQTIAVAESLTGGALCAALVDIPGASAVLRGAVVAYANEVKSALLGVDPQELAALGAVTEQVALAMARGVRQVIGQPPADWAVATTGVAGPDPDPISGAPAGIVYLAVVGPDGREWSEKLGLVGTRDQIRQASVAFALGLIERALGSEESGE